MIAVAWMFRFVFRGETIGDDLTFHMAESARLADCLRHGDWDFWNPSANAGFASLYYYQAVPQLASAIPAALFGHHLFWFQLSLILPLVLAPAAAYRGARLLGATPWQAAAAALAVALLSGQSRWGAGADGTFQVGLYTQTWALAAFPLALGHAARWIGDARGLAPAIAWGAFVGLCHPIAVAALGIGLVATVAGHVLAYLIMSRPTGRALVVAALGAGVAIHAGLAAALDDAAYLVAAALCLAAAARLGPALVRGDAPARPSRARVAAEIPRLAVLGVCMIAATAPLWVPWLVVDYDGFGGFPHRVDDEVGPGYAGLLRWQLDGAILDFARPSVLTWLVPLAILLARPPAGTTVSLRWLGTPAFVYAALLALGPALPKVADDLLAPVRFLGALQVVLAIAAAVGTLLVGRALWDACGRRPRAAFALRTGLAAVAAALFVLLASGAGPRALGRHAWVLADYDNHHRDELLEIADFLRAQPPGRKQVTQGTESHWWNLLTYVYARVPSLLQMGGGGLQASPNYDFVWSVRDLAKLAWVYDAPYLVLKHAPERKGARVPDRAGDRHPAGTTLLRTAHYEVRRLAAPGLISPVRVTGVLPAGRGPARAAAIAWLRSDAPLADEVLAYAGHGDAEPRTAQPAATVRRAARQDSPGDEADLFAEVEVTGPGATTFVARESWHPRWRAFVDGVEVPVRRVTPDFPAVDVPPGRHLVQLRFERPWWATALWLALPGVTLLAWACHRAWTSRCSSRARRARGRTRPASPS